MGRYISNSIDYINRPIKGETPNYNRVNSQWVKKTQSNKTGKPQVKPKLVELSEIEKSNKIIEETNSNLNSNKIIQESEIVNISKICPERDIGNFVSNRVLLNLEEMKECTGKRVFVRNEILYEYSLKFDKVNVLGSRKEDKMFALKTRLTDEQRKLGKLRMYKKVDKFRQLIASKLK